MGGASQEADVALFASKSVDEVMVPRLGQWPTGKYVHNLFVGYLFFKRMLDV